MEEKIRISDMNFMDYIFDDFKFNGFINAHNSLERKMSDINGEIRDYEDPDALSKKLYESLKNIYSDLLPQKLGEIDFYGKSYCWDNGDILFSSDYIGPSATQAFKHGVEDTVTTDVIKICRKIGGHIIWPRHQGSINQARASVCDRIDITLLELKNFYETNFSSEAIYSSKLRGAFCRDLEWIKSFQSFEQFCDAQLLVGSFVDCNYSIINLAPIFLENNFVPNSKDEYLEFMFKNTEAVAKRTEVIKNLGW